jgi:DNA-directed RNA polymerase specialized sigma24 family protein
MASDQTASSVFGPPTDWSRLGKAAEGDEACLDWLIRQYSGPLKIFFIAAFPGLKHEAEAILQDFAEDKILKNGWLQRANRDRGQFRNFLKTSLRNFVLDRLSRAEVKNCRVSLEEAEAEMPGPDAPSEQFDLAWVRTVLAETLRRMEADCKNPHEDQPRRSYIWEVFRIRVLDPILNDAAEVPYDQLVKRFGLKSPTEASNTLLSAKRIFKAHLNKVVREYAEQDAATAAEVKALEEFVAGLARRG